MSPDRVGMDTISIGSVARLSASIKVGSLVPGNADQRWL
jgi:hypothetical protein